MSQQWGEANPQTSNQWGEYMMLLATPGLPSCSNTDYLAGTSNPDFGAGTSNPDFGAGTYNSEIPADSVDVPNLRAVVRWELRGHVKCNPSYGIKHVIQNVKDQTVYDVPYQKAWYSLKMAREIVYGTWESSVQKLPKYLGAIQKYNPGTIVEWKHKGFQQSTGKYVMGYVFWAFKPCIDGFQFCRKIISVDGTHLYTKYKYKLLIAAAMDGNQQDLYWQAGSEYQLRKFNCIMEEIKKQDVKAFAYLDQINKEKWTASHDGGWRCGILTTNMSECINGVLKGARRLPAASMVKDYYDLMAYNNTYSKHFEPVQSEDYWDDPNFQLVHDPTIRTVTRPGRNQTTRIHNEMDWRQTRARQEAQQQQGDSSIQENVS
ncbi:UNVERIFIED_CONTAM: hypothetical protein Scaly_0581700 [Sesamum calycinum]|uniref:Uncharacterized protein n=1 Tax=Sesamum calycinum TaxID=2727403 RepID=A0AAW2RS97_9LAMI